MLIHKATMGVLDRVWTGQYILGPDGVRRPAERQAALSDVDDPDDWWEIPSAGPLARTARRHYPWISPQTGPDGELAGVIVQREAPEREQGPDRAELLQEAQSRGYKRAVRMRPKGLMPFLNCTGICNNTNHTR